MGKSSTPSLLEWNQLETLFWSEVIPLFWLNEWQWFLNAQKSLLEVHFLKEDYLRSSASYRFCSNKNGAELLSTIVHIITIGVGCCADRSTPTVSDPAPFCFSHMLYVSWMLEILFWYFFFLNSCVGINDTNLQHIDPKHFNINFTGDKELCLIIYLF